MRQPKVSMVMPCYNKVQSIGEMFDSIIRQEWNNIELILVNDGSTDGTREVIAEYTPGFKERGYEVVIIDQENAGVCAAAKAGFERVTGDLICTVDSDDELDPAYVGTMAGWLAEHGEYDFAACEALHYTGRGEGKQFRPFDPKEIVDGDPFLAERWLLSEFHTEPWRYMVRAEYFRKCRIAESYYTRTRGSHEPGYIIPLLAYGGKLKYFPLPMYHFNVDAGSHSRGDSFERVEKYMSEYLRLCNIAVDALPEGVVDLGKKQKLLDTAAIAKSYVLYHSVNGLPYEIAYHEGGEPDETMVIKARQKAEKYFANYLDAIAAAFSLSPRITARRTAEMEGVFHEMVKNCLVPPQRRIVGCGASHKANAALFRRLEGTPLEPTELWDDNGDGVMCLKTEYADLRSDDIIIVGPFDGEEAVRKVIRECTKTPCHIIRERDAYCLESLYRAFPELVQKGRAGNSGKFRDGIHAKSVDLSPAESEGDRMQNVRHSTLSPFFPERNIPIVFSADDCYAPFLGVSIASLLKNASPEFNYDIIILTDGMSPTSRESLSRLLTSNSSLRFVEIGEWMRGVEVSSFFVSGHINIASYYRLFIPNILVEYDKVLYLDCDLVIQKDIVELFATDLGENLVGGVCDTNLAYAVAQEEANGIRDGWLDYFVGTLGMRDPHRIIQCGVLLFNLKKMRAVDFTKRSLDRMLELVKPKIHDQCVLNSVCQGQVSWLDMSWNFMWILDEPGREIDDSAAGMLDEWRRLHADARNKPAIIHYATRFKPWIHPEFELADIFWEYAGQTPFYDELVARLIDLDWLKLIKAFTDPAGVLAASITANRLIRKVHRQVFSKYHGINKGRDVVLLATGPSLAKYKGFPGAVHMGVNRAYRMAEVVLDYHFIQDFSGLERLSDEIAAYGPGVTKKFYGIRIRRGAPEEKPGFYDKVEHYFYLKGQPGDLIYFSDDIEEHPLMCNGSVIFSALQFALYTMPNRIFLVGCDSTGRGNMTVKAESDSLVDGLLRDWSSFKAFADRVYPEVEIISVNPVRLEGLFADMMV